MMEPEIGRVSAWRLHHPVDLFSSLPECSARLSGAWVAGLVVLVTLSGEEVFRFGVRGPDWLEMGVEIIRG